MGSGLAFRQFSHGCFHEYLRFLFETSLHSARRPLDGHACGSCYVPCVLRLDPLVGVWAIRHQFSAGRPLDLLVGVPAHLLCYPASVSGTSCHFAALRELIHRGLLATCSLRSSSQICVRTRIPSSVLLCYLDLVLPGVLVFAVLGLPSLPCFVILSLLLRYDGNVLDRYSTDVGLQRGGGPSPTMSPMLVMEIFRLDMLRYFGQ